MSLWFVLACALLLVGCGKRGSPLAPIVRVPAQVATIAARRVADDVYVTLTVPRQNIDATIPADVARIDVYGYTGRSAPPPARFTTLGTFIASIPVVPAPPPGAVNPLPPDPAAGGIQGQPVTIVDTLSDEERAPGRVNPPLVRRGPALPPAPAPATPPAVAPLRRFYMAIPFGPRERAGPTGPTAEVTLTETLQAPANLVAGYTPASAIVTWEPVGGLIGYLIETREIPLESSPFGDEAAPAAAAAAVALPGTDVAALPPGPTRYNLYRDIEPDPLAMPGPPAPRVPWRVVPPVPLAASLAVPRFVEPVEFERARCYTLRAVRGVAPASVESAPTPPVCVRFVDIFPPAPPAAPAAVPAAGAISLIWEPNAELDLGGYVVLRGEAGDATLAPLTPAPIFEASYRDATVTPGTRYVYAVQAVDNRLPVGNISAPSLPVEETAR